MRATHPADESLLSVWNGVCGYGVPNRACPVLSGVNFSLSRGESVVLLGPNGSGKSTLLRSLSGLLPWLDGNVELRGQPIQSLSAKQIAQLVASVPQDEPTAFPFLVREVVALGRLSRSSGLFDTEEDRAIAKQSMARADCLAYADRPVTQLSGGERQRVLIARALAQDTPILLLDEPTAHLDVAHQWHVARLVRGLTAEGRGVISAIHDLNLAEAMGNRAILLHQGTVVIDSTVADTLQSKLLDEVYGVSFIRIQEGGRTIVLPPSTLSAGA